ncbi:MAG TPA: response regulator transcription factor [Anaerolineales bacterium]|nr:response regulator transcription factor [Anaerolineales bacterium]
MTSILIVEDHALFAQSLLRVLREKGHWDVVAIAGSAEEALEKIPGLAVDLVLVDVSLPKTSGISLVFLLHEKYPNLPCVMLSGHLSPHYVRTSLEAGARGYLVKDRADKILIGIRRVLEGEIYVSEELQNLG